VEILVRVLRYNSGEARERRQHGMTYTITEPCINVKDRSCVEVCPVDCIHPKADEDNAEIMLYIHPDECIDCGACESVCPVTAIFAEADVPDKWKNFNEINADYFKMSKEEFAAKHGRDP
jgi:NAD-dependent dihydropyrimidine dehydrogenase PreA subunit